MFGMDGHFCKEISELQAAIRKAQQLTDRPTIINVIIDSSAERRPQAFNWLTESKL